MQMRMVCQLQTQPSPKQTVLSADTLSMATNRKIKRFIQLEKNNSLHNSIVCMPY